MALGNVCTLVRAAALFIDHDAHVCGFRPFASGTQIPWAPHGRPRLNLNFTTTILAVMFHGPTQAKPTRGPLPSCASECLCASFFQRTTNCLNPSCFSLLCLPIPICDLQWTTLAGLHVDCAAGTGTDLRVRICHWFSDVRLHTHSSAHSHTQGCSSARYGHTISAALRRTEADASTRPLLLHPASLLKVCCYAHAASYRRVEPHG